MGLHQSAKTSINEQKHTKCRKVKRKLVLLNLQSQEGWTEIKSQILIMGGVDV